MQASLRLHVNELSAELFTVPISSIWICSYTHAQRERERVGPPSLQFPVRARVCVYVRKDGSTMTLQLLSGAQRRASRSSAGLWFTEGQCLDRGHRNMEGQRSFSLRRLVSLSLFAVLLVPGTLGELRTL